MKEMQTDVACLTLALNARQLLNRQALLDYGREPQSAFDYLWRELNLMFGHARKTDERASRAPSSLDDGLLAAEKLAALVLGEPKSLSRVSDEGLAFATGLGHLTNETAAGGRAAGLARIYDSLGRPTGYDVYVNGTAGNTQTASYPEIETLGVYIPQDPDAPDEYAASTGRVFIAKTPELFTHDPDSNLLSDGRFTYTWNGENRLILAETRADLPLDVPRHRVTYAYDHQGRMVSKELFDLSNNCKLETNHYLWDGWNIIRELTTNHYTQTTDHCSYVWGTDLSGTMQGAGGVGGLLVVTRVSASGTQTFFPLYDGNGNITEYADESGAVRARYEYDAFGNITAMSGDLAHAFPLRFSTKYFDTETGLHYYGYRFYSPELGRWLSRDPIGERGGVNLYGFVGNAPLNLVDGTGLSTSIPPVPPYTPILDHFDRLWMQLAQEMMYSCQAESFARKNSNGDEVCCTYDDCVSEANSIAKAYADALRSAYHDRDKRIPGGWLGNIILGFSNSGEPYPGALCPGLNCGGWQGLSDAVAGRLARESNCWEYETMQSKASRFARLFGADPDAGHTWGELNSGGNDPIPLDPWGSGGFLYK